MDEWKKALSKDNPSQYARWPLKSREELEATSIHRQEGLSAEDEAFFRRCYTQVIMETGRRLKISHLGVATATAMCHRYYISMPYRQNDCFVVACAALLLGAKVEESAQRFPDLLRAAIGVRYAGQSAQHEWALAHMDELQAAVGKAERSILYIIDFEMRIQHPFRIASELTSPPAFNLRRYTPVTPSGRYQDITDAVVNVANASLQTTLILQYPSPNISVAVVHLAMMLLKCEDAVFRGRFWWQHCPVPAYELSDMVNQILEVLEQRPLDMPQCIAPQLQPSRLLTAMPTSEAVAILRPQYDVPLDSDGLPAPGLHRSAAVSSPPNHTNAAWIADKASWQDHENA